MILPTKHLPIDRSLLGIGAEVLQILEHPKTISRLWSDLQLARGEDSRRLTFDWFVLSLDLLYTIGAIGLSRGCISRSFEDDSSN